jgi:hypothetical protein
MYNQSDLEQIEVTIQEAEDSIAKLDALNRLRKNQDFKMLFEEGYLKEESARLVLMRAEPNVQNEQEQALLNKMIDAVGFFRQYLNKIYQFGNHAKSAIEAHRQTRTELMDEAE